jgi:hypothetical protein
MAHRTASVNFATFLPTDGVVIVDNKTKHFFHVCAEEGKSWTTQGSALFIGPKIRAYAIPGFIKHSFFSMSEEVEVNGFWGRKGNVLLKYAIEKGVEMG